MVLRSLALLAVTAVLQGADAQSRFAPFGQGLRVHYESYGVGNEALIFIHGWTCDLTFWRGQEPLYSTRRSLLVDLPGHGQSSSPIIDYPTDLMARGVEAAMRDAGVDRAVLIGHSLGGPVAYALLRQFPAKVKAIVLVDSSVPVPSGRPRGTPAAIRRRAERARAQDATRARDLQGPNGERALSFEIQHMFSSRTSPELRQQILTRMLATPAHVRAKAVTSPSALRSPTLGTMYGIPSIAIQAEEPGTHRRYEEMKLLFPRMQLEAWQGYGHFLMMEDPDRFNASLEKFLAGLSEY